MPSTASRTHLDEGETLGIVGESGCGKSVSVLSVMRLIPQPPGKIVAGKVMFEGRDLLMDLAEDEIRQVRGNRIAMIFQDPMTSLNPVLTIGQQDRARRWSCTWGWTRTQARRAQRRAAGDGGHPRGRRIASTTIPTSSRAACASG